MLRSWMGGPPAGRTRIHCPPAGSSARPRVALLAGNVLPVRRVVAPPGSEERRVVRVGICTCPGTAGPGATRPGRAGPGATGPGATGPRCSGPRRAGPGATGPGASSPRCSGPRRACPGRAGPRATGPRGTVPRLAAHVDLAVNQVDGAVLAAVGRDVMAGPAGLDGAQAGGDRLLAHLRSGIGGDGRGDVQP